MKHVVLTVGRMFGSGGREIGKKVAEKCEMVYYDKELLELAAKESGMSVEVLENIDESASNSLLYSLSTGAHLFGGHFAQTAEPPLHDKLYIAQANIIKEIAHKESLSLIHIEMCIRDSSYTAQFPIWQCSVQEHPTVFRPVSYTNLIAVHFKGISMISKVGHPLL